MSGLPTLRMRESLHIRKIQEFEAIIASLKPQATLLRAVLLENLNHEDIDGLYIDIELLKTLQKLMKERFLLKRISQKIKVLMRERVRRDRINNLTVTVALPSYDEVLEEDIRSVASDHMHTD